MDEVQPLLDFATSIKAAMSHFMAGFLDAFWRGNGQNMGHGEERDQQSQEQRKRHPYVKSVADIDYRYDVPKI